MLFFLDKLISYIAPHECLACGLEGALLCSVCLPLLPEIQPQCYRCYRTTNGNKTCASCRRGSPLECVWIRSSYDGFAEALVRSLKFNRALMAADTIAASLANQFISAFPKNGVIVPIPTASGRVRQRGYDQSVLIAKALSRKTKLPYSSMLLRRGQQRQTGSSRSHRLMQLQDAFQIKQHKILTTKEVILVDDVFTTGATLEAAARTIKQAKAKKVHALVFARAE